MVTRFGGWPDEALEFFEGLEADNTKAYWQDHKRVFELAVRGPMEALLDEVAPEFGPFKIFRPYRDVRFSRDKAPYKTHIAAGGLAGSFYVDYSAEGLLAGAGYWHMGPELLLRYRAAVDAPTGAELEQIAAALSAKGLPVEGESLKRAPKGYLPDHPRIALLRHTSVVVSAHHRPARWMATRAAKDRVIEVWRAAAPLLGWLDGHVGQGEPS